MTRPIQTKTGNATLEGVFFGIPLYSDPDIPDNVIAISDEGKADRFFDLEKGCFLDHDETE